MREGHVSEGLFRATAGSSLVRAPTTTSLRISIVLHFTVQNASLCFRVCFLSREEVFLGRDLMIKNYVTLRMVTDDGIFTLSKETTDLPSHLRPRRTKVPFSPVRGGFGVNLAPYQLLHLMIKNYVTLRMVTDDGLFTLSKETTDP